MRTLERGLKEAKAGKLHSFKDVFGQEQRLTKALKPLKDVLKGDGRYGAISIRGPSSTL